MKIKTINRNIPENRENINDRFRVRYKNKNTFDVLEVNICRLKTNEIITYKFKAEDLPDKDSIYFTTYLSSKDKFIVEWKGIITKKNNTRLPQPNNENYKFPDNKEYLKSFLPIVGEGPKVLILGTMPGNESIRQNQYYANPRNSFWKIIYNLFNKPIEIEYDKRKKFLKLNKIAIWDICYSAKRKSSLDSDISNEIPNDIEGLIKENPSIELITFNGQKAEKLYSKFFNRFPKINYITLLSSSPANTSYTFDEKFNDWKIILEYINKT